MSWLHIRWNSIHTKLLTTYLLLITLASSLMAGYILWSFYAYFMKVRQVEMQNWSRAITESVADALEENKPERVQLLVQRYGAAETITIRVFNNKGQLQATSNPKQDSEVKNWMEVPGVRAALEKQEAQGVAKGVLSNDDRLFNAQPIVRNGKLLGALRMSVCYSQMDSARNIGLYACSLHPN